MRKFRLNIENVSAFISYFCIFLLFVPSLAVMIVSVNNTRYGLTWKGFTLDWYLRLFKDEYILEATFNTLIVAIISTIVATILGTALALGIFQISWKKRYSRLFNFFINLPIVVPDIIMAVGLTLAFGFLRYFSSIFEMGFCTLIISHITFQISFVALTVRSRLATINKELNQATKDLYASYSLAFTKVILPLLTPSIMAGAMLAFTLSLDDFIISFFTHGPESVTLPIFIYSSLKRGITPEIHALSTVMLIATVILVIFAERLGTTFMKKKTGKIMEQSINLAAQEFNDPSFY
jgi:spermidine/putrescine transport system permease protein